MKNVGFAWNVLIFMAAISSTVLAQRTSSAIQTVTFGVHRSSPLALGDVSLVHGDTRSQGGSLVRTLQNTVSTYAKKVTVHPFSIRAMNDGPVTAVQSSARASLPRTLGSGSVPGTSDIRSGPGSSYDVRTLVVTITE